MSKRDAGPIHDPHVIKKQRDGGSRHGEVTYYAVGWQRSTRSKARDDLRRFLNAGKWDALLRHQRDRALSEGARLRETLEQALSVIGRSAWGSTEEERRADLLLWGGQLSVEASRLQKALASAPLSKLSGEVIGAALNPRFEQVILEALKAHPPCGQDGPETPEEYEGDEACRDFFVAMRALRTALAREGSEG